MHALPFSADGGGVSKVVEIAAGGLVTREQQAALMEMDRVVSSAIDDAKRSGVPVGLIVATIHAHDVTQTLEMIRAK